MAGLSKGNHKAHRAKNIYYLVPLQKFANIDSKLSSPPTPSTEYIKLMFQSLLSLHISPWENFMT